MSELTLSNLQNFLVRYREMVSANTRSDVETLKLAFERLKTSFHLVKQKAEETARKTAPTFNVFYLLGLSRYETRTHSAMLAYLLDPDAGHGQRFLFLSSFLGYCAEIFPDFPSLTEEIEKGHWQTTTELATSYGRMDIVVISPSLNYLLVIENKIDALEQPYQLERYATWMEAQREDYPTQALVYLTIRGQAAITATSDKSYYRLSYRTDIYNWLVQMIPLIQASNVREVIMQYRDLISVL